MRNRAQTPPRKSGARSRRIRRIARISWRLLRALQDASRRGLWRAGGVTGRGQPDPALAARPRGGHFNTAANALVRSLLSARPSRGGAPAVESAALLRDRRLGERSWPTLAARRSSSTGLNGIGRRLFEKD